MSHLLHCDFCGEAITRGPVEAKLVLRQPRTLESEGFLASFFGRDEVAGSLDMCPECVRHLLGATRHALDARQATSVSDDALRKAGFDEIIRQIQYWKQRGAGDV